MTTKPELPLDANQTGAFNTPPPLTTTAPVAAAGRYLLLDEIARGGMGAVFRATDTLLDREVAIKVLRDRFGADSVAARRFVDEARIAGQLQHPGIPAVHDLGTLSDGRPFLAMKLVKGRTLADLLRERTNPAEERGRFVAIFEQICQAVGYAHAHQVIHRDLKPPNIMVGAHGEVQVMDWGLAKVLGTRPAAPALDPVATIACVTEIRSQRDSTGSETLAGSVLGTPAYMPPEQAIGAIDKTDARSDVFGLGAILLVILTGEPPFVADTSETARQLAARARLDDAFARLDRCGADPELIALCKHCLGPEQADRPADAGIVAQAVADLRAAADERAHQSELERAKAEAEAREQKKRRRVQLALFTTVGVLLLGVASFAWWQTEQNRTVRERHERNAEAVAGLLDQCEESLRAGDAAKATLALDAARKRAGEGGADDLAQRLERLGADLAVLRDLDAIDQFRWIPVENKYPHVAVVAARYREALGRFGADPHVVATNEAVKRVADSAVRNRLVAALDRVLREGNTAEVRTVLRGLDPHPFRDAIRDAILAIDFAKVADLAARPVALEQPSGFAAFLGDSGAISVERRRQLVQAAIGRQSGNLGLLLTMVHTYPINLEDGTNERLRWCQAAVAAAPDNVAAHINLGYVLSAKKDLAGAEAAYKQAIRIDPKYAVAHTSLGAVLRDQGNLDGAIASFEQTLRIEPKNTYALHNLSHVKRLRELLHRLPDVLAGQAKLEPPAEACEFAHLCGRPFQKRFARAVRLYEEGFVADPKLAQDLSAGHRYNAACYAVRAAGGEGIDPPVTAADRMALRTKALAWLRADLADWKKQAASANAAERKAAAAMLAHWLTDSDLSQSRPELIRAGWTAEETTAWNELWADVRTTLAETQKSTPAKSPALP